MNAENSNIRPINLVSLEQMRQNPGTIPLMMRKFDSNIMLPGVDKTIEDIEMEMGTRLVMPDDFMLE
jgi:hypothetical protein